MRGLALPSTSMAAGSYVILGVFTLVPLIRLDLPLSGPSIGALATMPWVAAALCGFAVAAFIDHAGAGVAVAVSQVFLGLGAATIALAQTVPALFLGAAVYGVGFGILNPATSVLSSGSVPARYRGFAMGLKQTGSTVGGVLAGLTLPGVAAVTSWRVAIAVTVLALAPVAWWGFAARTDADRAPLVLQDRIVHVGRTRLAAYAFVMSGTQLLVFAYMALFLVDDAGVSPQLAGVGLTVVLAAGALARVAWGSVSDGVLRRVRVLELTAAGSAAMFFLLPFVDAPALWLVLLVIGVCAGGWNGVFLAVVAESADVRGVGHATSAVFTFVYAGCITLPPLMGLVYETTSWQWFWFLAGIVAAVAALVVGTPRPVRVD